MTDEFVTKPWDSPGLPPRRESERCAHHAHCAYRDDDPARCPRCHATWIKIEYNASKGYEHPCDKPSRNRIRTR